MIIQIVCGMAIYVIASLIIRIKPLMLMLNTLKKSKKKDAV